MKKKIIIGVLVLAIAVFGSGFKEASAKEYPSKNIQMIVTFGAGGGTDIVARNLQPILQKELDQTVTVTNMPGAAGAVATEYVSKAKPDGYTVLFGAETLALYPTMAQTDQTINDFRQIGALAFGAGTFVVPPDSEFSNLGEMIKYAKENPGELKMSVSGIGDAWYVVIKLLEKYADIKVSIIPYNSGNKAAIAAMQNEVDVGACGLVEAVDFLANDQLKALAVADTEPMSVEGYGEVPAITDYLPDMAPELPAGSWWGPLVPKGTPDNVVNTLADAFREAVNSERFRTYAKNNAIKIINMYGQEAQNYAKNYARRISWFLYDVGAGRRKPSEVGIERLK